ncbi:hypothetical protein [Rhizobium sp. Leaf321]|uniref:hypothetical protein n=1 Tax=Rhizobium sp. Leaf321 TaxID=1736335 RepID=UPI0012E33AFF|nr:hypothetical protein [Rhizobium sp. Leaf321]
MKEFFIALVGAVCGSLATVGAASFGYLSKDRELDIEMVRVSLNILSGERQDTSGPGRRFALRALAEYSGIKIPPDEFEKWVESGTLPKSVLTGTLRAHEVPFGMETTSPDGRKGLYLGDGAAGLVLLETLPDGSAQITAAPSPRPPELDYKPRERNPVPSP